MNYKRCRACGTELSNLRYFDGVCSNCNGGVLAELLQMGDLPEAQRLVVVGMLHSIGAETCARFVTRVPFTPIEGER